MILEKILAYVGSEPSQLKFEVFVLKKPNEDVEACFTRLVSVLKAYFGDINPGVYFIKNSNGINRKNEEPKEPAVEKKTQESAQTPCPVTARTITVFRELIKEKAVLSDEEAEEVLKKLFGVQDLKDASLKKAVSVLERIASGQF